MKTTNVEDRIMMHQQMRARQILKQCPWMLPEKIARHYVSLAVAARQLLEIIEVSRKRHLDVNDELEIHLCDLICNAHMDTFGHPPSWASDLNALKKFWDDQRSSLHQAISAENFGNTEDGFSEFGMKHEPL
jgi:hypothetical protein